MTRIGLISDTHGYLDDAVIHHFNNCDEIWHAGDFGSAAIAQEISTRTGKPLKGVYGNIDGNDIRRLFPEKLHFNCEGVNVFIQHIGGYPRKYAPGVEKQIIDKKVSLFISGHSHILKIMYDDVLGCLHINPGAAGKQGWHKVRTIVCFTIEKTEIKDCNVIELDGR